MAKIVLRKAKKQFVEDLKREVVVTKFQKLFAKGDQDVHTAYGIIKKENLRDGKVQTDRGKEFAVFSPSFIDHYKRIERLPQIIPLKDIGMIIATCGLGKESIVIDTGTGSGGVACFLANICKHIYSYEVRDEHLAVSQKNVETLGLQNVEIKKGDATKGFNETDVDCIIYDLPAPWEAIDSALTSLKVGGFLVSYSPTIPQTMDFVQAVEQKEEFLLEKVIEVTERPWQVDGRTVRPKSKTNIHSGFLVFVRRIT